MPPPTPKRPPQTLRQAKKAYQKAGPRLSESELRRIERTAELQERAARMRERENKRKANLKKKIERQEKDREARARMNIPSPVKGFYVGPSQIRLSGFLGAGMKRKREETESATENKENDNLMVAKSEEKKPEQTVGKASEPEMATTEKPKSQKIACKPSFQQMSPPKSRAPLQPRSANPIIPPKPLFFAEPAKLSIAIDDDWDSFLASNTQIEQDLAGPDIRTNVPVVAPPPARPFLIPVADTTDILDMISTQDLDYTDENAPIEPSIAKEELKYDDCLKATSYSRDEAKINCNHGHKVEYDYKAEFRDEWNNEEAESDYGDEIYESDPKDEICDSVVVGNHQILGVDEPHQEPKFENDLSETDYPDDTSAVKTNPHNPGSDFDDGIQDSEFQTFITNYEFNPRPPSSSSNNPTEPFREPQHTPELESFDCGDFELSTQEMRELETCERDGESLRDAGD